MNYIPEVAKMLGVEIGEEFMLEGGGYKYKFSEDYLLTLFAKDEWRKAPNSLSLLLNGEDKLVKLPKPILDEKEKDYLSAVIRPFRDKIKSICKSSFNTDDIWEWIQINFISNEFMYFPYFKKGTMYKGMKTDRKYSLKELGL